MQNRGNFKLLDDSPAGSSLEVNVSDEILKLQQLIYSKNMDIFKFSYDHCNESRTTFSDSSNQADLLNILKAYVSNGSRTNEQKELPYDGTPSPQPSSIPASKVSSIHSEDGNFSPGQSSRCSNLSRRS